MSVPLMVIERSVCPLISSGVVIVGSVELAARGKSRFQPKVIEI